MALISQDELASARQMDLLTYLQLYDPGNLVRISGQNYCTREHDSLKISNGKWYWFSRGIGGASALDYLIKVQGYSFPKAVYEILGKQVSGISHDSQVHAAEKPKELVMPYLAPHTYNAKNYLISRGIHPDVISYCVKNKLIFETARYRSVLFAGYDKNGRIKYAALRGTKSAYKGEAAGSDKRFSFSLPGNPERSDLHLFESAIDLLSYASILHHEGKQWTEIPMLSLGGVYISGSKNTVPEALERYLKDFTNIRTLHLHLDNDETGRGAAKGICESLSDKYTVIDEPVPNGKDVNDYLMAIHPPVKRKEEYER